jgi:uncharacterized membrane protein
VRTRNLRSFVYITGGLGLIFSLFTALEVYESSLQRLCTYNSFFSCGAVDSSGHTTTFGVPDSLIGILGFVVILVIAGIAERWPGARTWPYLLVVVTGLGTAASLYFLYVQLAIIGAFCVICGSAYVFGWVTFGGAVALARRTDAERRSPGEPGPADDGDAAD